MLIMAPAVCTELAPLWQVVGWVLWVFKIAIPILIIVFGMIDLGKAVVASKDDEIKKALKQLMLRAVAGVVIFFIPNLVGLIFSMVGSWTEVESEYKVCETCIVHPSDCNVSGTKTTDDTSNKGGR